MIITDHAHVRMKERLKLPMRSHLRQATRAFEKGCVIGSSDNEQKMVVRFNDAYYVYGLSCDRLEPVLVTVITFRPPYRSEVNR